VHAFNVHEYAQRKHRFSFESTPRDVLAGILICAGSQSRGHPKDSRFTRRCVFVFASSILMSADPPRGQTTWTAVESGFSYAVDLVKYIRQEYGDYFCVSVAGYPEGHIDSPDKDKDFEYLKQKVRPHVRYKLTSLGGRGGGLHCYAALLRR
jgi:hypothetical protein